MKIAFQIPGRVKGWQRARYNSKTGAVFNSTELQTSQGLIKDFANRAMGEARPFTGALKMTVRVLIRRPKSHTGKKRTVFVTGFPDYDNTLKTLGDSMNHIVYDDDRQIAVVEFERRYTDDNESVAVTIEQLEAVL